MDESADRGPILGPALVVLAGLVVAAVPFRFQGLLSMVGGGDTTVGLMFGTILVLIGIAGHLQPTFSRELGVLAIVFSIFSLFGTLGGMVLGLVLGLLGGNMLLAWRPNT
jgi:hypothetical protein